MIYAVYRRDCTKKNPPTYLVGHVRASSGPDAHEAAEIYFPHNSRDRLLCCLANNQQQAAIAIKAECKEVFEFEEWMSKDFPRVITAKEKA